MSRLRLGAVTALLILGGACGWFSGGAEQVSTPEAAAPTVDVARFAALARRIQADPARGAAILDESGVSRKDLEEAMFAIASDPAMSAEYDRLLHAR